MDAWVIGAGRASAGRPLRSGPMLVAERAFCHPIPDSLRAEGPETPEATAPSLSGFPARDAGGRWRAASSLTEDAVRFNSIEGTFVSGRAFGAVPPPRPGAGP